MFTMLSSAPPSRLRGGDVLVNGHKVTNYFYSAQYQDLKTQDDELQEHVEKTLAKIAKYPDDEDFKADLLKLSGTRNEIRKKLEELKQEVIRLAETFTKIPINSDRLKLARQHFEAGNFSAARAILDAEQMGIELDDLLQREEHLQQQQAQVQALRMDKANEFPYPGETDSPQLRRTRSLRQDDRVL